VEIRAYTRAERIAILAGHSLPRLKDGIGFSDAEIVVDPAAVRALVTDFDEEPGVRGAEGRLRAVVRRALAEHLDTKGQVIVTPATVRRYLRLSELDLRWAAVVDGPGRSVAGGAWASPDQEEGDGWSSPVR
jgi:ATP-dependent Lon protease